MNREKAITLTNAIKVALVHFAKDHAVQIDVQRVKYDGSTVTIPLRLSEISEEGVVMTREREAFTLYAESYGLKPEWLGRTIHWNGAVYTLDGIDTRSRKFPVLVTCKDSGKRMKFRATSIPGLIAAEEKK